MPVIDPDASVEFNLTEFLRLGLGAGYRLVPSRFGGLGPLDLGGPSVTAQIAAAEF